MKDRTPSAGTKKHITRDGLQDPKCLQNEYGCTVYLKMGKWGFKKTHMTMIREHHDKPLGKKNMFQPVDFGDLGAPSQSGERLHWGPGSADWACDLLEVEFPPKSAEINSWNRDWAGYCPVHRTNLKPDDHDGESKHLALKTQHVTCSMWHATPDSKGINI